MQTKQNIEAIRRFEEQQAELKGMSRREKLQLVAAPRTGTSEVGKKRKPLTAGIVPGWAAEIYAVFDNDEGHATAVGLKPEVQAGLLQLGGPSLDRRFAVFDLSMELFTPAQECQMGELSRDVYSPLPGRFWLEVGADRSKLVLTRSCGEEVLLFELANEQFEELFFCVDPQKNSWVRKNQLLFKAPTTPISAYGGLFADNGEPIYKVRQPWVLSRNKTFELNVFIEANNRLSSHATTTNRWLPGVLAQVDDLEALSQQPPTAQLERDILAALSEYGVNSWGPSRDISHPGNAYLGLTAHRDGVLIGVREEGCYKILQYADGYEQWMPRTAVLRVTTGEVTEAHELGDFVVRKSWSWPQLVAAVGDAMPILIHEFLRAWAIAPGQSGHAGPGLLLDHRYLHDYPVMLDGKPAWFWDFREATEVHETGAIFWPTLPYANTEITDVHLPTGIEVSLSLASMVERVVQNKLRLRIGARSRSRR